MQKALKHVATKFLSTYTNFSFNKCALINASLLIYHAKIFIYFLQKYNFLSTFFVYKKHFIPLKAVAKTEATIKYK